MHFFIDKGDKSFSIKKFSSKHTSNIPTQEATAGNLNLVIATIMKF